MSTDLWDTLLNLSWAHARTHAHTDAISEIEVSHWISYMCRISPETSDIAVLSTIQWDGNPETVSIVIQ